MFPQIGCVARSVGRLKGGRKGMYTVTLIDDEYWALKGIANSYAWEKHGFRVVNQFTNPLEALEKLTREATDVVITDVCMDALNGLEVISTLRSEGCIKEFIVVSGYDRFDFAQKSLRLGVFDYLLKPIKRSDMEVMMEKLYRRLQERDDAGANEPPPDPAPPVMHVSLNNILSYIQAHYEESLSLRQIAEEHFLSETYVCDLFRKHLGKTFSQYLQELRMERACALLLSTPHTVSEIAGRVGYADVGYFCRVFRRCYACSPAQYRRDQRRGNENTTDV